MAVTVEGASDDLIEIGGDIYEEFPLNSDKDGDLLAFSDGTILRVMFDPDGTGNWRFTPVRRGSAYLVVVQAVDGEDGTDVATLTGDVTWVVHGTGMAAVSAESKEN